MAFTDGSARLRPRPARRPKRALYRLRLEPLEDRTLLATINWIAGSGNFHVGSNWSGGVVPGPNDVAVIDTGSTAATITINRVNIQVQAINTTDNDTLYFPYEGNFNYSGTLTVTAGNSTLNGPLVMEGGASLTATGSGVSLTANGTNTLSGGYLFASGGAQISFPTVTSYIAVGTLQASGPGSTLTFGGLTSISKTGGLTIKAVLGGQVQLPALTAISDTRDFVNLSVDGTGSTINVSALSTYMTNFSTLTVTNGGAVLAGALTTLTRVSLNLDGTGTLPVSQWTAYTNAQATISGGTETFTSLANIDGSGFRVNGGAQVSLPALTSYTLGRSDGSLVASGSGSTLTLSALTSITSQPIAGVLDIIAAEGGRLQFPALTTINMRNSMNNGLDGSSAVRFLADGAGSTIDAASLTTFLDSNITFIYARHSSITITNGGTLVVGALTQFALNSGVAGGPSPGGVFLDGTGKFNAAGPINLSGVALVWTSTAATPLGSTFAIVNATGGVTGTFKGLPEGAIVNSPNGAQSSISYQANGGKTVLLTQLTQGMAISSFTPTFGLAGTVVTITGTRFTGATGVAFGSVNALTFTVNSDTQITATVPVGPTTGPISVFTPTGKAISSTNFTEGLPPGAIVTGADADGGPQVRVYDANSNKLITAFFAYDPNFTGGVRVAVGDVNGDGIQDIVTAPGPGGGPDIRIYDGHNGQLIDRFFTFDPNFTGGSFVAVGDMNGDGFRDIICGADAGGGPNVSVFSGKDFGQTRLLSFFPYDPAFTGGVRVAAGDTDGDGRVEIITGAGTGGGPNVTVYQFNSGQAQMLQSYFAYDPRFTAGVYVAAGDVNGDGHADVVVGAGAGGGPNVAVYNGADASLLSSFFAFDPSFTGGVRVAASDRTSTGRASVLAGPGPGGGPQVRALDGLSGALLDSFFAYDPAFTGGLFVAARG